MPHYLIGRWDEEKEQPANADDFWAGVNSPSLVARPPETFMRVVEAKDGFDACQLVARQRRLTGRLWFMEVHPATAEVIVSEPEAA